VTNHTMLLVRDLVKSYDGFRAVDGLSFEVHQGEIFGLLGPNGSGKTTTIRTIMDIFKPDSGTIEVLGKAPGLARTSIGYLPEERGLYRDLKVLDVLVYLAELKGTPRAEARRRADAWLERVELSEWAGRRVRDLSRGMQQKLQFVAGLIHEPQLLILDEPFQGLDPVNVDLIKRLMRDLATQGKTLLLSAHEMSLVEALSDRIVLIDQGQAVLYGRLDDIKRRYAQHSVRVKTPKLPTDLAGVTRSEARDGTYTLTLESGYTPRQLMGQLAEQEIDVESFEVATMPLEEIFIAVVKEGRHA
jgi:ABC-2 type transport system ATP-binding protein